MSEGSGREADAPRPRRWPLVAIVVLGLGLAAAPVAFSMFSRAPAGGTMIDDFKPYMTAETLDEFRGYLDEIGAARDETTSSVEPAVDDPDFSATYPQVAAFVEQWDGIFPWFFVVPGVAVIALALVARPRSTPASQTPVPQEDP